MSNLVGFMEAFVRQVQIAEAKTRLSATIEQIEGSEEIVIARRNKPVGSLILEPRTPKSAAELFRAAWSPGGLDLEQPLELPLDAVDLE